MRILITGVCGLLGQNLLKVLSPHYSIIGVDVLDEPKEGMVLENYLKLDITHKGSVTKVLQQLRPEIIINTAAMTNVDACEDRYVEALKINYEAVETMIDALPSAKFIQISTDYVFDGEIGYYFDNSLPNPISWYGKTKLFAETATLDASVNNLVVRTMVIVGKANGLKQDFISFVRESLCNKKSIKIVTDQIGNITLAYNLAENIKVCIEKNVSGIIAIAGKDRLSRFDIAVKIAEKYKLDSSLISPILTKELNQPAKRPLSSGFMFDRAKEIPEIRLLSFDEILESYDRC